MIGGLRPGSTQEQPELRCADNVIASGRKHRTKTNLIGDNVMSYALLPGVYRRDERAEETECGPSLEFFMEGLVTVAA